jgi:hypothetical protein
MAVSTDSPKPTAELSHRKQEPSTFQEVDHPPSNTILASLSSYVQRAGLPSSQPLLTLPETFVEL